MKKNLIITIISLLLLTGIVSAATWTQYTPSPTTSTLVDVESLEGYAFASTSTLANCYLYNSSGWQEVLCPDDVLNLGSNTIPIPSAFSSNYVTKVNSTHVAFVFGSGGAEKTLSLILYDARTNTYRSYRNTTNPTFSNTQWGTDLANGKVLAFAESNSSTWELFPGFIQYYDGVRNHPVLQSDSGIYISTGVHLYQWGGISWVSRGGMTNAYKVLQKTSNQRAVCTKDSTDTALYFYNTTSGQFDYGINMYSQPQINGCFYEGEEVFVAYGNPSAHNITRFPFNSQNLNSGTVSLTTASKDIYDIDIDRTSGIGWAVGESGYIYKYTGTGGESQVYDTYSRVSPNPSIFGNEVIFYSKAQDPDGQVSNLTLNIYDETYTTLMWTTTQNNIPSGLELEMLRFTTNSPFWATFPPGTYIVETEGCRGVTCSVGNQIPPDYGITTWQVIPGETTNETTYELDDKYVVLTSLFDGLNSITNLGEDDAFATIRQISNNDIYILSFDTGGASIISSITNSTLQSDGTSNPTSSYAISTANDRLFIGTDDELYTYNGASNLRASQLTYENNFALPSEYDIFPDVEAVSDTQAFICQDGRALETDDIYEFNSTEFINPINFNPCKSLKNIPGFVVASKGSSTISIYSTTNQSLAGTITIGSISNYATHDLLSIIDDTKDYLFAISGQNEIRKYDITNKISPILKEKCRLTTGYAFTDITSIEALDENITIIGGYYDSINDVIGLLVCDFANNETYNGAGGYYEAQILDGKGNAYGIIREIQRMNDEGKFHTAEETAYGVYNFRKTTETIDINNNPIIDDYTIIPSTTICKNQVASIEIIAHDPDSGDYLSYGVSCSGGGTPTSWQVSNTISCYYSTTGTKTVTMQVRDQGGAYSDPEYDYIIVNDCTANTSTNLFFKILDGSTAQPIVGATINIYDDETLIDTGTTNSYGQADFTSISTYKLYRATISSLPTYATKTEYFYPSDTRYIRYLDRLIDPNATEQRTILIVNVMDADENPIEGVLVATLEPTTGASVYSQTDYDGTAYLFDVKPSPRFLVTAKKEPYETTSIYTSIGTGETKTLTITMGEGTLPIATNRGCADTIRYVILCGNLTTTGIGNTCTQDSDCISGRCSLGLSVRTCSKFNYTLCDSQGINRGNTCIFRNVTNGLLASAGNWILDNFLYVLVIVVILVFILIIMNSRR